MNFNVRMRRWDFEDDVDLDGEEVEDQELVCHETFNHLNFYKLTLK